MAIAGGVGLVKSVGYGLILAPADFGRLSLVNSVALFLVFGFSRGTLEGVALELPRLYGAGRHDLAAGLLRRTFRRLGWECSIFVVLALAALACDAPAVAVWLAVPMAASTGILSLVMTDTRSRGSLGRYGGSVLGRVILSSLVGLPAAALLGFKGAILGESAAQALLVLWLMRSIGPGKGEGEAAVESQLSMHRRGRAMMLHQLMQLFQQNGDKWIISLGLGAAALGQYSFAGIFLVAVSLIHGIAYQQIGPAALRSLASGESAAAILRRVERSVVWLGAGVAVLGALTAAMLWVAQGRWFTAYAEGIGILPWIVLTAVFQVMNQLDWIVATGDRLGALVKWDIGATVLFFGLGAVGIMWRLPLLYYAILACAMRGFALALTLILARHTARTTP